MKFEKQILTEGLYVTGDGKGGRQVQLIDRNRIKHWTEQHYEMRKDGLNIPAPELHDPKAVPTTAMGGSKSNFGFWEEMSLVDSTDSEGNSVKALNGILDVPVDDDAKRIGKSVKETSIYAVPEFIDGTGKVWKDVLTHVAVVTKPIEPGQKNFVPLDGALALSMSHRLPISMDMNMMSQILDDGDANPDDLYQMLEQVAGISIPRGTSPDELQRALLAALAQKKLSEQARDGGTVTKPPKDSQLHEVPVVMSNNNSAVPVEAGTTPVTVTEPPATEPTKTVTVEMSHLQQQNSGLMTYITEQKKSELKNRLAQLRHRGIISDENMFNNFNTQIESITSMSFGDDHKATPSPVELQIGALEMVQIKLPDNQPMVAMATQDSGGNFVIQPNPVPATSNTQLTDERADEIVNMIMGTTSV